MPRIYICKNLKDFEISVSLKLCEIRNYPKERNPFQDKSSIGSSIKANFSKKFSLFISYNKRMTERIKNPATYYSERERKQTEKVTS